MDPEKRIPQKGFQSFFMIFSRFAARFARIYRHDNRIWKLDRNPGNKKKIKGNGLCRFSLSLFNLFQRLHSAVKSMSVVPSELRICALEGGVSVSLWLFDPVSVGFCVPVVLRAVL